MVFFSSDWSYSDGFCNGVPFIDGPSSNGPCTNGSLGDFSYGLVAIVLVKTVLVLIVLLVMVLLVRGQKEVGSSHSSRLYHEFVRLMMFIYRAGF